MGIQVVVLGFSGVAYLIMNALLVLGISGMWRGLRLFRNLGDLSASDASEEPLPESELFVEVANQLTKAKFSHIGNFRVGVTGDKGHVEYVYTAPNRTTYASVATFGDYINVGMFTLFGDEACVETHMAQGPGARNTQISKPDYILQTFAEDMPLGALYKRHKQAVRTVEDTDSEPTVVQSMDDLLAIEDIYIDKFTRRRLRLTFQPGPIPIIVLAVFYLPLSLLVVTGLATEFALPVLVTALLPLSVILAAIALGLAGIFMVVSRRSSQSNRQTE